jgi:hypothetical protein
MKWLSTVHGMNNIKFALVFTADAVYKKCVL